MLKINRHAFDNTEKVDLTSKNSPIWVMSVYRRCEYLD